MEMMNGLQEEVMKLYDYHPIANQMMMASTVLTLLVNVISHVMSMMVSETYRKNQHLQIEWNTRINSCLYCPMCTMGVFYIFWKEWPLIIHDIFLVTFDGTVLISVMTGYLMGDLLICIYAVAKGQMSNPWGTLVHHTMGIVCFLASLYNFTGYVLCLMMLATEASTVFLNIRWYLYHCEYANTTLYKLNGIVMTIVFFTFRVAMFPFHCWMVYRHAFNLYEHFGLLLPGLSITGLLTAGILNHYWFGLMIKGMLKLFSDKNAKKSN